jgi:hypothetical protein
MNALLLAALSLLPNLPALQAAPPTAPTSAIPTAREDAPRQLKIIDLRELLKGDLDGTTFETGMFTTYTGKPPEPAESKDEKAAVAQKPNLDPAEQLARRASAWQEMLSLWIRPAPLAGVDTLLVTRDGTLIANLTEEAHAWLDRFLALQRETKYMVGFQIDFVTGPRGAFDRLTSGGTPCVLAADDAKRLIAEARAGGSTKVASSMPLVAWIRMTSTANDLRAWRYVKDWRVETVEPGRRTLAVPEVGTADSGRFLAVRAVPLDATHVGLEITATQSTIKEPVETKKVKLAIAFEPGGEREVEIALPAISEVALKGRIPVELGGYAMFTGASDADGSVAVLVHVDRRAAQAQPVMQTVISSGKRKGSGPEKH